MHTETPLTDRLRPLCCVWNDMCICKTSIVIRTSSNLTVILDFEHTSTSRETRSTTIRKFGPENIVVAVGILSLCALELRYAWGHFSPYVAGKRHKKTVAGRMVNDRIIYLLKSGCPTALHIAPRPQRRYHWAWCVARRRGAQRRE